MSDLLDPHWLLEPEATPFVTLPGGTFPMGATVRPDEQPVHEVTIGAFAVAMLPVSNAQYRRYVEASGYAAPPFWEDPRFNAPLQPVVGISWFDTVAYCDWLSERVGRRCRLPTEAEREFAARGGCATRYPWGDEPLSEGPFAFGAAGTDRPLRLGSVPPNGYGLYHMAENVHEWCSEWYDPRGYGFEAGDLAADGAAAPAPDAPETGQPPTRRASRGGSWRHRIKVSRIAARSSLAPDRRYNDYGLRVYADA